MPGPPPSQRPMGDWKRAILAGIIVLLVAGGIVALYSASHLVSPSASSTPGTQINTQATLDSAATANESTVSAADANVSAQLTAQAMTPQPTTPPVTPTSSSDIGVSLSSGNWLATVNSVKSSQGSQYVPPKAGNIYLLINATMKDTDVSNHTISIIAFSLRDDQGNSYPYAYVPDVQELSGDVVAGQQLRGYLIFEVPKSLLTFTLQFNPGFDASQAVQWNLRV